LIGKAFLGDITFSSFKNNLSLKQYFADRDIFCAGRVAEEDLKRVAAATGGTVQTSVNNIIEEVAHHLYDCYDLIFL